MLITSDFAYHHPISIVEAEALLQKDNIIVAGGSDVLPQLKTAVISPAALVDLGGIEELKKVEERDDGIHIGSMATLSYLAKNKLILEKLPAVSSAARNVASPQIRNRGTIGGNLLQARRCFYYNQTKEWRLGIPLCYKVGGEKCIHISNSPVCRALYYSDVAPVMLAYNAKAVASICGKETVISCRELLDAHCEDRLEQMLLKEFFVPKAEYTDSFSMFTKYSLRGGIDFPVINFAGVCNKDTLRIFVGAIATHVVELTDTEAYIKGKGRNFEEQEALEVAIEEMKKKNQIIRESGISVQVKRGTFHYIKELLTALKSNI